ncbi:MAG TPA: hypothetical protein VGX68_28830 [Thermoanaerobaculia bacterium]|jgi:hypothetical protein|nr:hypothetical protein [Thermoanaerobaculia bacterium]
MGFHGTFRWRRASAVLLCLAFASCFESPVREELLLRFLPNGAVVATSRVEIFADQDSKNPALARRLAETRRTLLEGTDAWGARFAAANPAAERFGWEKRLGDLRVGTRSAVIGEPEGLAALFGDTSIGATYRIDADRGVAELMLTPGASTRATRRQREEMKRTLGTWSAALAEYLEAGGALYAYLERQPDRARTCFGMLFVDMMDEEEMKGLDEPRDEEEAMIKRLNDAMRQVTDVLLVPEGAEFSADEVSHLVYDPFPARLAVKLPGRSLEMEGFQTGEDGTLSVSGLGLWEALRSLEGRWLSPDPVLFYVAASRQGEAKIDLDAFVAKPRNAAPPDCSSSAEEVREAIVARLRPAPIYRVSWQVRPDDETPFRWDAGEGTP